MATNEAAGKTNELFREFARTRDIALRNRLVEHYLYLVDILIRKYLGKGVEYDDLHQVGSMALIAAVDRFDPERGFEFSSFATPTIIGEVKRYFRDKGWALHLPRRIKDLAIKLDEARESFLNRTGRQPTVPEMAEALGVAEEDVLEAMESRQNYRAYSLNQAMDESDAEGGGAAGVSLEAFTSVKEQGYEDVENLDLIQKVLDRLSDREKTVFKNRILGEKTQKEIAEILGVSQMTVSRLENDIREKFRAEYHR
ncbi:MAG: SigB/SigF/SigG family RNA polymerase sigma factor [Clostridiales Family XIII bacterium]|nr:SigB/SigF/SigG family RNA polymerase sigma factor [Clostridiales Family XIII bacterium]